MNEKIYYLRGSRENPDSVEQALLEVCPNAKNNHDFGYCADGYYYAINDRIGYADTDSHIYLLKLFGEEIHPILEEKVKFRLPTKEEMEDLVYNHFTKWNKEKRGLEIMNKKGDILFLPACGYYDDEDASIYDAGFYGYYWSSTITEFMDSAAYYLYFDLNSKDVDFCDSESWYTVRLVSDEPFEGSIEFNGVYWKITNEDGYYSWAEAMRKFNKE